MLFLGTATGGCKGGHAKGDKSEAPGLQAKDVIGSWGLVQYSVKLKSKGGEKIDSSYVVKVGDVLKESGKKPPRTSLFANGNYREEIVSLQDSLLQLKLGTWHIYEDSLYLRQNIEGAVPTAFGAERSGAKLLLKIKFDMDGDGEKDDLSELILKKK